MGNPGVVPEVESGLLQDLRDPRQRGVFDEDRVFAREPFFHLPQRLFVGLPSQNDETCSIIAFQPPGGGGEVFGRPVLPRGTGTGMNNEEVRSKKWEVRSERWEVRSRK